MDGRLFLKISCCSAIEGAGEITIRTFHRQDTVCIEFRDTGTGMSPEELEHIFDFGFSTTGDRVRMEFGLSMEYGIIEAHDGHMKIESAVGKGTQVTISLPRRTRDVHCKV